MQRYHWILAMGALLSVIGWLCWVGQRDIESGGLTSAASKESLPAFSNEVEPVADAPVRVLTPLDPEHPAFTGRVAEEESPVASPPSISTEVQTSPKPTIQAFPQYPPCRSCGGTGRSHVVKCLVCGGSGRCTVYVKFSNHADCIMCRGTLMCKACKGTRYRECQSCFGSGFEPQAVMLGMTAQEVRRAWGNPSSINTTQIAGNVSQQWVYEPGTLRRRAYVYLNNGIVTAIQY